MGYINNCEKTCYFCKNKHHFQKLGDNNSFGMRDLDTRPPGMMRNLMHLMVEKCPKCGYASYDISKNQYNILPEELKNNEYCNIFNNQEINFAIKKFMLVAKITECHNSKISGMSYLRAAWMADDSKNNRLAMMLRSKAIKYLELSLKEEDNENVKLIIVDLYRRINMFEEASDYAKYLLNNFGMEKYKQNILLYQIQLCSEEDCLDHTIPGNYNFYCNDDEKYEK